MASCNGTGHSFPRFSSISMQGPPVEDLREKCRWINEVSLHNSLEMRGNNNPDRLVIVRPICDQWCGQTARKRTLFEKRASSTTQIGAGEQVWLAELLL